MVADELRVYWRVQGGADWNWELLTPTGAVDTCGADMPAQVPGTTVEYYLAAVDNSGRSESLPRSTPAGFYSFLVLGMPGDLDYDGDVDLDDFAQFGACMAGPGSGLEAGCECFNFDRDADLDLTDFVGFQTAFLGSGTGVAG